MPVPLPLENTSYKCMTEAILVPLQELKGASLPSPTADVRRKYWTCLFGKKLSLFLLGHVSGYDRNLITFCFLNIDILLCGNYELLNIAITEY